MKKTVKIFAIASIFAVVAAGQTFASSKVTVTSVSSSALNAGLKIIANSFVDALTDSSSVTLVKENKKDEKRPKPLPAKKAKKEKKIEKKKMVKSSGENELKIEIKVKDQKGKNNKAVSCGEKKIEKKDDKKGEIKAPSSKGHGPKKIEKNPDKAPKNGKNQKKK